MLKIAGKLQALGYLLPDPLVQADGKPPAGAIITMADGRNVTVSGLTPEEVRKLAGDFGEPITLKLEGLPC